MARRPAHEIRACGGELPAQRADLRLRAAAWSELAAAVNELDAMFRASAPGCCRAEPGKADNLDDTHVFCRQDQVEAEAARGCGRAAPQEIMGALPGDYVRRRRQRHSPATWHRRPVGRPPRPRCATTPDAAGLPGLGLS